MSLLNTEGSQGAEGREFDLPGKSSDDNGRPQSFDVGVSSRSKRKDCIVSPLTNSHRQRELNHNARHGKNIFASGSAFLTHPSRTGYAVNGPISSLGAAYHAPLHGPFFQPCIHTTNAQNYIMISGNYQAPHSVALLHPKSKRLRTNAITGRVSGASNGIATSPLTSRPKPTVSLEQATINRERAFKRAKMEYEALVDMAKKEGLSVDDPRFPSFPEISYDGSEFFDDCSKKKDASLPHTGIPRSEPSRYFYPIHESCAVSSDDVFGGGITISFREGENLPTSPITVVSQSLSTNANDVDAGSSNANVTESSTDDGTGCEANGICDQSNAQPVFFEQATFGDDDTNTSDIELNETGSESNGTGRETNGTGGDESNSAGNETLSYAQPDPFQQRNLLKTYVPVKQREERFKSIVASVREVNAADNMRLSAFFLQHFENDSFTQQDNGVLHPVEGKVVLMDDLLDIEMFRMGARLAEDHSNLKQVTRVYNRARSSKSTLASFNDPLWYKAQYLNAFVPNSINVNDLDIESLSVDYTREGGEEVEMCFSRRFPPEIVSTNSSGMPVVRMDRVTSLHELSLKTLSSDSGTLSDSNRAARAAMRKKMKPYQETQEKARNAMTLLEKASDSRFRNKLVLDVYQPIPKKADSDEQRFLEIVSSSMSFEDPESFSKDDDGFIAPKQGSTVELISLCDSVRNSFSERYEESNASYNAIEYLKKEYKMALRCLKLGISQETHENTKRSYNRFWDNPVSKALDANDGPTHCELNASSSMALADKFASLIKDRDKCVLGDLGCGHGTLASKLALLLKVKVIGLEIDFNRIKTGVTSYIHLLHDYENMGTTSDMPLSLFHLDIFQLMDLEGFTDLVIYDEAFNWALAFYVCILIRKCKTLRHGHVAMYRPAKKNDVDVERLAGMKLIGKCSGKKYGSGEGSVAFIYEVLPTTLEDDQQLENDFAEEMAFIKTKEQAAHLKPSTCVDSNTWRRGMVPMSQLMEKLVLPMWNKNTRMQALEKERQYLETMTSKKRTSKKPTLFVPGDVEK